LLYTLSLGGVERNISKQLRQAGAVSKAISNRPVLLPGLQIISEAFWDLHPERDGSKLIPTVSVLQYAREYGLSDETRDEMVTLIRRMDLAYIKHKRRQHDDASRLVEDDEKPKGKNRRARK
jgi:hypothetical protein